MPSLPPILNAVWADAYARFTNPWNSRTVLEVLKDPYFSYSFVVSAFIQIFTFYFLQNAFPKQFAQTRKQRAWILTLQNSLVTALGSLPFLYDFIRNGCSLVNYPSIDNPFSRMLSAFFITYLLADMIFGAIYYRELMDPMTGWFHHSLYTVVGFQVVRWRVPGLLGLYLFLETPTLLLSMGQINKAFRKDLLYGSIFFSTRIVFHLVLAWSLFTDFHNYLFLTPVSVFPIHILWFRQWIVQQIKKYSAPKDGSVVAKESKIKKTASQTTLVAPISASSTSVHIPRQVQLRRANSTSSAPPSVSTSAPATPPKPKRRFLGAMAAAHQPAMARLQQQALRLLRYRRGSNHNLP